jgi:hypothetical protein
VSSFVSTIRTRPTRSCRCRFAKREATVTEDPREALDFATRTGARYMGADRADEFGRRNAVPGEVTVRVRPTKVIAGFEISD